MLAPIYLPTHLEPRECVGVVLRCIDYNAAASRAAATTTTVLGLGGGAEEGSGFQFSPADRFSITFFAEFNRINRRGARDGGGSGVALGLGSEMEK